MNGLVLMPPCTGPDIFMVYMYMYCSKICDSLVTHCLLLSQTIMF